MKENKIGNYIVKLREYYNLTQQDLAEKISISAQAISKWELGESEPDIETVVRILDTFGLTTEEIEEEKYNPILPIRMRKQYLLLSKIGLCSIFVMTILLLYLFVRNTNDVPSLELFNRNVNVLSIVIVVLSINVIINIIMFWRYIHYKYTRAMNIRNKQIH